MTRMKETENMVCSDAVMCSDFAVIPLLPSGSGDAVMLPFRGDTSLITTAYGAKIGGVQ